MLSRLRRRNRGHESVDVVEDLRKPAIVVSDYPGLAEALDRGDVAAGLAAIDGTAPGIDASSRTRMELQIRHEILRRLAAVGAPDLDPLPTLTFQGDGRLPDVAAAELDVEVIRSGVRGNGAVIVRGLFDANMCALLREDVDAAVAHMEERGRAPDPRWYTPIADLSGQPLSPHYRSGAYGMIDGTVHVADAPSTASRLLSEFDRRGITSLVAQYLQARPSLSLQKWVLRRVPAKTHTSWHQDGAFMGHDLRALNLWVALSDCGEDSPGLDIVARRYDSIVPTGTEGSYFDWDVAPAMVDESRGEAPIVSPVFHAGDAVFFDHFTLHRTGVRTGMTADRYALESWFFPPTGVPGKYSGFVV